MNRKLSTLLSGSILAICILQSCIKEKNLYQDSDSNPTYSELSLNLGGDCIVSDQPLNRAANNESHDIVGITVSMITKNGTSTTNKPYAYGIFTLANAKDKEKLKLNVIDGYNYRISCTMIKNAKDSIKSDNNKFGAPFNMDRNDGLMGECLNKFITAEQPDGLHFPQNLENAQIKSLTGNQDNYKRPFIERYHGMIDELTPGSSNNTLKLYRRYFGVIFKQTGLQEGKLKIKLDDAPCIYLNASADKKETVSSNLTMVSMKNLTTAIPATGLLTENVKLEVFFCSGVNEEQIISTTLTAKRNYKHTIVLTNIDHMGTPSNIGIEVDEEEMQDDFQQDIPWQD